MVRKTAGIEYHLTVKNVKNINLRVAGDGRVTVSAGRSVSLAKIDTFVASKTDWILKTQNRLAAKKAALANAGQWSDDACLACFNAVSDKIYPLFAEVLPEPPAIRVRLMKSRWGVCHRAKNCITLNKLLMGKPDQAIYYVVLHEYVHFLHPNHQKGFYAVMDKLMPGHREVRRLLK